MSASLSIYRPSVKSSMPSDSEFLKLSGHLKRLCGINLPLNEKNLALMSSRLQKLRAMDIGDYKIIISALDRDDIKVSTLFVSAMTTNTTHFFRENQHFDFLKKVVAEKAARMPRLAKEPLRVWCAASSTGEEPYGLSMTLHDLQDTLGITFKLLATDIDYKVLTVAKAGIYTEKQVESVSPALLQKYFIKENSDGETVYRVRENLKNHIQFGRFNLLKNYPFQGRFDIIFCRNVLIYFDKETVSYVIEKMVNFLYPGGYLFLGHSEAIAGMSPGLKRAGPAVYERV